MKAIFLSFSDPDPFSLSLFLSFSLSLFLSFSLSLFLVGLLCGGSWVFTHMVAKSRSHGIGAKFTFQVILTRTLIFTLTLTFTLILTRTLTLTLTLTFTLTLALTFTLRDLCLSFRIRMAFGPFRNFPSFLPSL